MTAHDFKPVQEWLQVQIGHLQRRLEGPLDPTATAHLRGQITAHRRLLAWAADGFPPHSLTGAENE